MDLNKAQIIGRVTQDIVVKQTPNGNQVASFSLATNRTWTDSNWVKQEKADFHNITCWGKFAEIVWKYASKGKRLYVEGRLENQSWEAEDGTKRYKTEIVCENLILLDWGNSVEGSESTTTQTKSAPAAKPAAKKEEEISIEDIPF